MQVELKSFKEHKELSDDSLAFSASLWIDGKRTAIVTNEGQGGMHRIQPTGPTLEKLKANRIKLDEFEAYCKTLPDKTLTPSWTDGEPYSIPMDGDVYIDDLVEEIFKELDKKHEEKFWKKLCAKGVVIRLVDFKEGQSTTVKMKSGATPRYTPEIATQVRRAYGDKLVEIVNERYL